MNNITRFAKDNGLNFIANNKNISDQIFKKL